MVGTIIVEFAGTPDEAGKFARDNELSYAKNLGVSPNGLPFISGKYRNHRELALLRQKFDSLGWPGESQTTTQYDNWGHRKNRV